MFSRSIDIIIILVVTRITAVQVRESELFVSEPHIMDYRNKGYSKMPNR